MGKKAEDEIQKKLVELELSIKEEEAKRDQVARREGSTGLTTSANADHVTARNIEKNEDAELSADLCSLGGLALLGLSVLMLFSHIKVGTGFFNFLGMGGLRGFILVPLFIGIGMLVYNYKSRVAQAVTLGSVVIILFAILNQLILTFPMVSMLELLVMVVPLTAGIALMAKASAKRKALQDKSR